MLKKVLKFLKPNNDSTVNFVDSKLYWEERYKSNRDSGSGSYGRLANFKAEILNDFVQKEKIVSVIELGCGDGNQLKLANYPNYIGIDVSDKAIEICQSIFKSDTKKRFFNSFSVLNEEIRADLSISLDVIYHLVEDQVFESYMSTLFDSSNKYVIIYSSNYDKVIAPHVKCRKFTKWIEKNKSDKWRLKTTIKNKYPFNKKEPESTSMSDFYIYEKIIS